MELCYHVIAILSCRAGGPGTVSYARRISAADRIQDLLCDGKHLTVPPLPLVPYAVGLTLTVTYRGLRDKAFEDVDRAQADLATRCEMLEALSTYWWTADAMARLGRKALKSLKDIGVRKASVANIATAMEGEVAVCKFGPFEGRPDHSLSHGATPSTSVNGVIDPTIAMKKSSSNATARGSGLHLLSDAAAAHSTNPPNPNAPSRAGTSSRTASETPTLSHTASISGSTVGSQAPTRSSPNTTFSQLQHHNNSYASGYSQVPASKDHSQHMYLLNSNRPSRLLGLGAFSAASSSAAAAHMPHASAHSGASNVSHSSSSHPHFPPTSGPFDTTAMDSYAGGGFYDSQFNDLDNLFEGFFDLSMPTIFQDPLFDGDAFLSADLDLAMSGMETAGAGDVATYDGDDAGVSEGAESEDDGEGDGGAEGTEIGSNTM